LDQRLSKRKFLNGDNVTIADIAVAAPMHLWKQQKLPLKAHPNLKRWIEDVEKLESWKRTQKAVEDVLCPDSAP
jgi:glutathione S-transferase